MSCHVANRRALEPRAAGRGAASTRLGSGEHTVQFIVTFSSSSSPPPTRRGWPVGGNDSHIVSLDVRRKQDVHRVVRRSRQKQMVRQVLVVRMRLHDFVRLDGIEIRLKPVAGSVSGVLGGSRETSPAQSHSLNSMWISSGSSANSLSFGAASGSKPCFI